MGKISHATRGWHVARRNRAQVPRHTASCRAGNPAGVQVSQLDRRLMFAMLLGLLLVTVQICRADEGDVLALSQALVGEANFTATNDHAAIAHVLQRRATQRGVSLARMCQLYVSVLRQRSGVYVVNTPRAMWIRGLTLDATKPEAWPANQSWAANAPRWLAVIATARAAIAGTLANPCPEAEHWGGDMDHVWRGLVAVECEGHMLNTFFRVTR
jgi:hypothetical protein